jgi:aryl-alcohol dehydrogenase-like predicted oxidoreductase
MNDRRLGRAPRKVSEIGFGAWGIGGDRFEPAYGPTDDKISRSAIRRALELGVTFFDTADIYGHGHSEALIGKELSTWPHRDQVTVATKGGINFYRLGEVPELDFTPYGIAHAVEQSRIRLRQDTLDLYLLMNPPLDLLLATDRVWETLAALRRAEKIRWIGVSVPDAADGVALLKAGIQLDAIEVPYNMFYQAASLDLLPLALHNRVAIIAREPLANGFLAGTARPEYPETDHRSTALPEYLSAVRETFNRLTFLAKPGRTVAQAALRFVLDHPTVTTTIPGVRSPEQIEEACAASSLPKLTETERQLIHQAFFPQDDT